MAVLYITECAQMGWTTRNNMLIPAPSMPPVAEQHLTISASSSASTAFAATTTFVLVATDATCSLAWTSTSVTVSAVTTSQRMAAGESRFYTVYAGGTVSVIANT